MERCSSAERFTVNTGLLYTTGLAQYLYNVFFVARSIVFTQPPLKLCKGTGPFFVSNRESPVRQP